MNTHTSSLIACAVAIVTIAIAAQAVSATATTVHVALEQRVSAPEVHLARLSEMTHRARAALLAAGASDIASHDEVAIAFEHARLASLSTATAAAAVDGAGTTIVNLTSYSGFEYVGDLAVGAPAQHLRVIYDTGSSDLWVFSDRIPDHQSWTRYFSCDNSTTCTPKGGRGRQFSLRYGKGSCSGTLALETAAVGSLAAFNTSIGLVTTYDTSAFARRGAPMDGLCGLSFAPTAASGEASPFWSLFDARIVSPRMFAFNIPTRARPGRANVPTPTLSLGAPDPSMYDEQRGLVWLTVVPHMKMWAIELTSVNIARSDRPPSPDNMNALSLMGKCGAKGFDPAQCRALIDSGTSAILLEYGVYLDVTRSITDPRPDCTFSLDTLGTCTTPTTTDLPTLLFRFGDRVFPLEPVDYTRVVVSHTGERSLLVEIGYTPIHLSTSFSVSIFGDTFLRRYYPVFDMNVQAPRVGFEIGEETFRFKGAETDSYGDGTPTGVIAGSIAGVIAVAIVIGTVWKIRNSRRDTGTGAAPAIATGSARDRAALDASAYVEIAE